MIINTFSPFYIKSAKLDIKFTGKSKSNPPTIIYETHPLQFIGGGL